MLTKTLEAGVIEILSTRQMQVREDTVIYEDEIEISRTFTRYVLNPGDDVSDKPQMVKDVAGVIWTPEVVSDWKARPPEFPLPPA